MTRSRHWVGLILLTAWFGVAASASAAPPGNDDFEHAAAIPQPPATVGGTVKDATSQPGEPNHGSPYPQTVWYSFAPDRTEHVAIRILDSRFDGRVSVYTGAALTTLQAVPRQTEDHRVAFDAVGGQTYRIVMTPTEDVSDFSTPTFRLRLAIAPLLTNDDFSSAQPISVPDSVLGTTYGATKELGEPKPVARVGQTVWYRLKSRRTVTVRLDTAGSEEKVNTVAVYRGTELADLKLLATGYGWHRDADMRFRARRRVTYYVAVAGAADFVLNTSDGSVRGQGLTLAVNPGQTVESVRARGLGVVVATRRDSYLRVELVVSKRTRKTLKLKSAVIGKLKGRLGWQEGLHANVSLTPAARRALAGRTSLQMTAVLTRTRTGAPHRVLRVPVRLPN
jgi:hypothetical protein